MRSGRRTALTIPREERRSSRALQVRKRLKVKLQSGFALGHIKRHVGVRISPLLVVYLGEIVLDHLDDYFRILIFQLNIPNLFHKANTSDDRLVRRVREIDPSAVQSEVE